MTAYVHATGFAEPRYIKFGIAWVAENGTTTCASISLCEGWSVTLHSPEEADALIAAATKGRDELIRLAAEAASVPLPGDDSTEGTA